MVASRLEEQRRGPPRHRGCDAGQAQVWAYLAGMGESRGVSAAPKGEEEAGDLRER